MIALIGGAIGGKGYLDVKKASEKSWPIDRKTSAKLPSLKSKSPFSFLFLGVNGKTANDILVLTVNPKQNKTTVVSLNRNIYLQSEATTLKELYGTKGTARWSRCLTETLLGVEIPRYMTFDMRGLGDFVEAVGGVDVQNDTNFISSGYEFKPGTLNLKKVDEVKAFLTKVSGPNDDRLRLNQAWLTVNNRSWLRLFLRWNLPIHFLNIKFVTAFGDNIKTDFVFGNIKALGVNYNGVLGNITKENLKPIETTIDGKVQKILSEDLINKAHDRIEAALNE